MSPYRALLHQKMGALWPPRREVVVVVGLTIGSDISWGPDSTCLQAGVPGTVPNGTTRLGGVVVLVVDTENEWGEGASPRRVYTGMLV